MQNKLQELTDRLYAEGLSKGKAEGDKYLADAKAEAEKIIADARKEAQSILAAASREAEDLKSKVSGDTRMAALQTIALTRQDVEKLIIAKTAGEKAAKAMADPDFLKEIIKAVAVSFTKDEAKDIALVLPESLKGQLESFVSGELAKAVGTGIKAEFSKKVSGGFTIAPADGSYFISFTDETFSELISSYLRPATRKILFG